MTRSRALALVVPPLVGLLSSTLPLACGAGEDHPAPAAACSTCTSPATPSPVAPPGGGVGASTASPTSCAPDATPTSPEGDGGVVGVDAGADTLVPQGALGDASPVPPITSDASATTPTTP